MVVDEVTDCANWEQLGIVIRYAYQQKPVERLIEYVKCDNIRGKNIANLIMESLKSSNGIDISYCRSQTYDGAGNMAGKQNGAARNFQKNTQNDRALLCLLINPLLNKMKQKIKPLCETRWVERHTAFEDLDVLYLYIILCLEIISKN